jgi:hypothetical protein
MKLTTERRWLSLFIGAIGLVITSWAFIWWIQLSERIAALAKDGSSIIDLSPDQFQMEARVGFAFVFASAISWSRGASTKWLVAAVTWLGIVDLIYLASNVFFGRIHQPFTHVATVTLILAGAVIWWRKGSQVLISVLAPLYLLTNYCLWYRDTQHIKEAAGVQVLYPPTFLNNLLYGAEWWHVLYLVLSLIVLIWIVRLILVERRNSEVTP